MGREGLAKRETFSAASAVHWKSERTFRPFRRKLGKKRKEGPAHFFCAAGKGVGSKREIELPTQRTRGKSTLDQMSHCLLDAARYAVFLTESLNYLLPAAVGEEGVVGPGGAVAVPLLVVAVVVAAVVVLDGPVELVLGGAIGGLLLKSR